MNLMMLGGPLLGALIGYCTNNIAVKMLFYPLHPVKIGNYTLPFTPGLIPRGQKRLAKAIGRTVGEELLTDEVLVKKLLSEEIKEKLRFKIEKFLEEQSKNERSINEMLVGYTTQEKINEKKEAFVEMVTDKIEFYLNEIQIGNIVADQVLISVKEHIKGTFLAMMMSDEFLLPITDKIAQKVDDYVKGDGICLIKGAVNAETEKLLNQESGIYVQKAAQEKEAITEMLLKMYQEMVIGFLKDFIKEMDLSRIVEDKIKEMDVVQVEELILLIMKKELNAVINLGAVIGFTLGLINLFF